MRERSIRSLVVFVLKHPLAGVPHVLPAVRFGHTTGANAESVQSAHGERDVTSGPAPDDAQDDDLNGGDPLKELNDAERLILEQQLVSAAERLSDRVLFGGREHDEDRFVRIHLKDSLHRFGVPGSTTSQEVVFEPRLLLHESGIAQLSLQLRADGPLTAHQVLRLMSGPTARIVYSEIPRSLVRGTAWESAAPGGTSAASADQVVKIRHLEPVSLTDASLAHLEAVLVAIGARGGEWSHYPIALVEAGGCCPSKTHISGTLSSARSEWLQRHSDEIHRLALGAPPGTELASDLQPPRNLSLAANHLLYAGLGSAIYIQIDGDAPSGIEELQTVLVLEYALLTYQRLAAMERQVSRLTLNERSLRRRYREAIDLFSVLRQGDVRAGEAREIIRHVLAAMGADQMRGTIESALNLTGNAHATVSASRAARRSWWITLLATIIAALVAAPSIQAVIDSARAENEDGAPGAIFIGILHSVGSLGFWGPWALMAGVVAAISAMVSVGWLIRHRPRHWPGLRRGYRWPNAIVVTPSIPDFADLSGESADPEGGAPA